MDAYQRYVVQKTPVKPETIALLGGSIALVVIVILVKNRRKGKRK